MNDFRRWLAGIIEPKDRSDTSKAPRTANRTFAIAADCCGIGSFLVTALAFLTSRGVASAILATALVALTVTFIALNFDLQRRYSRESRRARAGSTLATCNAQLTHAAMALNRDDQQTFGAQLWSATATLAEAFEIATGHPCRAAVMDLALDSQNVLEGEVQVLARSRVIAHGDREATLPDAVIKDNTDFQVIIESAPYFFSNDLAREHGYKNSHFDYPMKESEYPYRSTIVWPIAGPHADPAVKQPQIIGFLCVDSKRARTFDRALDVPTGQAIASAMYSALSLYRTSREAEGVDMAGQTGGGQ